MDKSLILNAVFSFALFLIGLMFLEGIWKKKGKVVRTAFNIDSMFFPNLKDKRIFKAGDQLAFLVCLIMAILTLANGVLFLISNKVPNVSMVFIFIAVILSWPIRIIFIHINKNKKYNELPRIWPFKK